MITVHYKPFESLRPVHLAALVGVEAGLSMADLAKTFGLPPLVLQHAVEDLSDWEMLSFQGDRVQLQSRGSRCVSVWTTTKQRGYWEFPDPVDWELDKGTFFFRRPLEKLGEAGFNPETGGSISLKKATEVQRTYLTEKKRLEVEILKESVAARIAADCQSGEIPEDAIYSLLCRAKTRLHLNQICRMVESAIAGSHSDEARPNGWESKARKIMAKARNKAERAIRDEQRVMQPVQEILLATWLSKRKGLLQELSDEDPCSILLRSDASSSPQTKKAPAKRTWTEANLRQEHAVGEWDSVLNGLKGIVKDLFK